MLHRLGYSDLVTGPSIREFREKFGPRKREANYRGSKRNDWWSVDFDLSELKELRLKQGIR